MLILTRRVGETVIIEPSTGLDADLTVGELFKGGPIVLAICEINGQAARIGIEAPEELFIIRNEIRRS